jgi:hypothetical protein
VNSAKGGSHCPDGAGSFVVSMKLKGETMCPVCLNDGTKDYGRQFDGRATRPLRKKTPREWRLGQLQTSQANSNLPIEMKRK